MYVEEERSHLSATWSGGLRSLWVGSARWDSGLLSASRLGEPLALGPRTWQHPSAWEARSGTKNLETVCRKALAVLEISGAVCWGLSGQLRGLTRADPAGVPRALHAKRLGPMTQVAISEWPRCSVLGRPLQTGDLNPPGFIPSQLWRPVRDPGGAGLLRSRRGRAGLPPEAPGQGSSCFFQLLGLPASLGW